MVTTQATKMSLERSVAHKGVSSSRVSAAGRLRQRGAQRAQSQRRGQGWQGSSLEKRSLVQFRVRSSEAEKETETAPVEVKEEEAKKEELPPLPESFVPVCNESEVPKGTRKELTVDGKTVLVFWYRNQLRCIEAKSTAEAFYSEGFKVAKFTQDYGIICPTTESVFSIVDGSILDWYPNNPVLSKLTPKDTCRPIEIYEVAARDGVVYVNPVGSLENWVPSSGLRNDFTMPGQAVFTKGGSDSSVENNNVYGVEPKMYLQGTDPSSPVNLDAETAEMGAGGLAASNLSPGTVIAGIVAVGIVAVVGTGVCFFYENYIGLALFWLVGISGVGYTIQKLTNFGDGDSTNKM